MSDVVFIALASIAVGTLLGLWAGPAGRAASPFSTFAMVTAVAVVLGQLLPEALGAIGILAFLPFAAGYAAPRAIERTVAAITKRPTCAHEDAMCTDLGLEVGFAGLLIHRIGDGMALGLYGGGAHAGHGHYDVILAIAGHTVPVTALVLMAFKTHRGVLSAALRALGITLATLVGIVAAESLPAEGMASIEPWVGATVGGLLLHIVTHGWPRNAAPTTRSRLADLAAIGAGLAIVGFGGHSHAAERGLPDVRHAMGEALWELGLETAPMLLLGLVIAAALQTQGDRIPARWLRGGSAPGQALRGALLGLPLPVCACGILPVAHTLKLRGGAPAVVVAFLLATPELGIETFALTVRFLGWEFAILRLCGAVLVAFIAALALARIAERAATGPGRVGDEPDGQAAPTHAHAHASGQERGHAHGHDPVSEASLASRAPAGPLPSRLLSHFEELLYHIGAWTLVGLLAAAYVQVTLTEGALQSLARSGLDVLVISLLAIPSYVCASSATPLAAVLLAKGVSPGAVLAGLLLGPATNLATLAWLRKAYGGRAAAYGVAGLLLATWALAFGTNQLLPASLGALPLASAHEHGPVSVGAALMLALLFLRAVWRNGLHAWLGSLGEPLGVGGHGQHGHGHGHGHGHHHGPHEAGTPPAPGLRPPA